MKISLNLSAAVVISALALVITNHGWASEEPTSRSADTSPQNARTAAPPARALSVQQASQRMLRQLGPEQALRLMHSQQGGGNNTQFKATDPKPPKYGVTDCTGSNGVPKVCCSYKPGGSGSSCDMFILLCDQMSGTTSAGGGSAATCSGDGVLE